MSEDIELLKVQIKAELQRLEAHSSAKDVAGKAIGKHGLAYITAIVVMGVMSATKDAPHPNAGKLLIDFLVDEEGQQIFRDTDYMPVDPKIPPRNESLRPDDKNWRYIAFTPEQADAAMPKWAKIYKDLFQH